MSLAAPIRPARERVAAAILEAAAQVFAERGAGANLAEVAAAAGVSRATLYRYFPSRERLREDLARVALKETGERLAGAGLERVSVAEGVSRAVRALTAVSDHYIVLAREHVQPDPQEFEERLAAPLCALFERGQAQGEIRTDVSAAWLMESLVGLVASGLLFSDSLGVEDTIAAITSLFLEGASDAARQDSAR